MASPLGAASSLASPPPPPPSSVTSSDQFVGNHAMEAFVTEDGAAAGGVADEGGGFDQWEQLSRCSQRQSRRSASGVDYKRLSGEVDHSDDDYDNSASSSPLHERREYANRHIPRIISLSLSEQQQSSSSSLQIVTDGSTLTAAALLSSSSELTLSLPILVADTPESIGMRIPRGGGGDSQPGGGVTIRDVADIIGHTYPVTVMDVKNQEELEGWTLGDLVEYFEDDDRLAALNSSSTSASATTSPLSHRPNSRRRAASEAAVRNMERSRFKVLNQISLEFSRTSLVRHTRSPQFVRDLDWIDNLWPSELKSTGDYPVVQYYCLTSTAGCYTDFHVDFGGTAVWYHILSGSKVFVLVPPTQENLRAYEEWLCRKDQAEVFYLDLLMDSTSGAITVTLEQNQTLIIPTGWIHAVYTPADSIVIGGNFLHGLDMNLQLDVYCIETRTRVPQKFRFPHFVRMMFYAGGEYLVRMRENRVCRREVDGMKRLIEALGEWWKVQPKGEEQKSAKTKQTVTRAAMDAAVFSGCLNVEEMLYAMDAEIGRLERDGIPEKSMAAANRGLKLKLTLKQSLQPSGPASTQSSSDVINGSTVRSASDGSGGGTSVVVSPRPKLKLKLSSFGADEGGSAGGEQQPSRGGEARSPTTATSTGGEVRRDPNSGTVASSNAAPDVNESNHEENHMDDAEFRIIVPSQPTNLPNTNKKRRSRGADLNPYRGGVAADLDDDEWVPGGNRSKRKRPSSSKRKTSGGGGGGGSNQFGAIFDAVASQMENDGWGTGSTTAETKEVNAANLLPPPKPKPKKRSSSVTINAPPKSKAGAAGGAARRRSSSESSAGGGAASKQKPKLTARDRLKKRLRF